MMDCKAFIPMQKEVIKIMSKSQLPNAQTARLFLLWLADQQKEAMVQSEICTKEQIEKFDNYISEQFKLWVDKTKPFIIQNSDEVYFE